MQRGLHEKMWQYVCGEQWEPSAPCCNHWSFAIGIAATASANEAAEGQHWHWLNAFLYRSIKIKDAPPKATEKPKTPVPTEKIFLIVPVAHYVSWLLHAIEAQFLMWCSGNADSYENPVLLPSRRFLPLNLMTVWMRAEVWMSCPSLVFSPSHWRSRLQKHS